MSTPSAWKSPWPWGIVAALGCVMVANALMIRSALQHPSAPASDDHYGDAQQWNEVIEQRAATEALQWTVTHQACPEGLTVEGCEVRLTVRDRHGAPVSGLQGQVEARRADDVRYDRLGSVQAVAEGLYAVQLPLEAPGLYRLGIRLRGAGDLWVSQRDVLVPSEHHEGANR